MSDIDKSSTRANLVHKLPEDLRDSEVVQAFLNEPLPAVTAMITGALAMGREQMVLAGGRVAQAILNGRTLRQLGKELEELHQKGKLRDDYADTKHGFHSLVDLLKMIEGDSPDADKLKNAKVLFVALNSTGVEEGEALARYQVFRIALQLSGSQLLLLATCYKLYKTGVVTENSGGHTSTWLNNVGNEMGHRVLQLIEQDEAVLMQQRLLSPRVWGDGSGITPRNGRLTDLGFKLCVLVEEYEPELEQASQEQRSPKG